MPELRTLHEFNNALSGDDAPYDLALKDGCATRGLQIPKSNWGRRIDRGPFEAYAVTAGITFTFGGIKITTGAEAEDDGGFYQSKLSQWGRVLK
jgi:tricarballylate dehydrogenase